MKRNYLLPNKFKIIGLVVLLLGLVQFIAYDYYGKGFDPVIKVFALISDKGSMKIMTDDWGMELGTLGMLIGMFLVALSKERDEDEMSAYVRGCSFIWSLWVTLFALIAVEIFVYGGDYITFYFFYPYLFVFVYICRFNYKMFRLRRGNSNDSNA